MDIGSGTGRYLEAVVQLALAEHGVLCDALACDASPAMLRIGAVGAPARPVGLQRVAGLAELLPFRKAAFDAVVCFNAIHHFDLDGFLRHASRVLRGAGMLIVYTRTREQNQRTVWGELFPHFGERETRLYSAEELQAAVMRVPQFRSVSLRVARWRMETTPARLLRQAMGRCYSTFDFYEPAEFNAALHTFRWRLLMASRTDSQLTVQNDHLVVVARRY